MTSTLCNQFCDISKILEFKIVLNTLLKLKINHRATNTFHKIKMSTFILNSLCSKVYAKVNFSLKLKYLSLAGNFKDGM